MNTVTSLFKKHFGGRNKVSREHPGVMEYLKDVKQNVKRQESLRLLHLSYCINSIKAEIGHDIKSFHPAIPVPSFNGLPDLFTIHGAVVDSYNKLYVFCFNGEAHEVESRPQDVCIVSALYKYLVSKCDDWRVIPGYNGYYLISKCGQVKSIARTIISDSGKRNVYPEKILSLHIVKGYVQVTLCLNGKTIPCKAHQLVARAFISNPNGYKQVNHVDGNKLNNCVDNLEWCTALQNIKHAFDNGLRKQMKGEENFNVKITNEKVQEIRRLKGKTTTIELAKKYQVSRATIYKIYEGETWKHI